MSYFHCFPCFHSVFISRSNFRLSLSFFSCCFFCSISSRQSLLVSTCARPCLVDEDHEGVTVVRDGRSCERMLLSIPSRELEDMADDGVVTLGRV